MMGRLRLFASVLLLQAVPAMAVDAPPPMLDGEGRPLVQVTLEGGRAFPFLLDTAASHTVIYRTLVAELDMQAIPLRSAPVMTATGRREMQLYRVGPMRAFGESFDLDETVALPVGSSRDAFGIVGVDLLRGRMLMVSRAGASLIEGSWDLEGDGWLEIEGRPVGRGSLAVTVRIGEVELPALVDTGAGASVINRPAFEALKAAMPDLVHRDSGTVTAAAGDVAASALVVENLEIGTWQRKGQSLRAADLPVFATFGARRAPAMILGADMLMDTRGVALDLGGWTLHVRP